MMRILGIYHDPWRSTFRPQRSLLQLYRRAVWSKANPRSQAYMEALFKEHWPDGTFVSTDDHPDWPERVPGADVVVLLYPDSIGIKFSRIERQVEKLKREGAMIRVLNGRRRDFVLDRSVRRQLRLRRLLERSMLAEAVAIVPFALASTVFVLHDLIRGRR